MQSALNATHRLGSSPETVHWGFLDASLKPVLHINSGDTVIIDCVSGLIGHGPDHARHSTPPELDEILTKVPRAPATTSSRALFTYAMPPPAMFSK